MYYVLFIVVFTYLDSDKQNGLVVAQLVDEEGPSLLRRMYLRSIDTISRIAYYLTSESIPAVIILVAWALIASLFFHKTLVPSQYSKAVRNITNCCSSSPTPISSSPTSIDVNSKKIKCNTRSRKDQLKIIELKAETYNGMVRLLKPGYRSIIVLIDQETKEKLLANFKIAVWPYRRNKPLIFGYLDLDKNLVWYRTLLERVLDCEDLQVNKKNCIGTVLSLNGFNKYMRVYHAKHHETSYYEDKTDNDGAFLGFNERNDDLEQGVVHIDENDPRVRQDIDCTVDNLLEKLPIWLDKVFNGLTKRYYLDEWPEEIN